MALNWYQCRHCNSSVKQDKTPSYVGCSSPKSSHHSWHKLAEVGNTNYQCRHCGLLIQAKKTPSYVGCFSPKSSHHSWQKM